MYMLTLVVNGRERVFGHIEGSAKARPGSGDAPHIVLSELGRSVLTEEVRRISHYYPMVEVWRVAMMPDHIHLLIRVKEALPNGKHLGVVVKGFKTGCTRAWWKWQDARVPCGKTQATPLVPGVSPSSLVPGASPSGHGQGSPLRPVLFEAGYHDRIIRYGMLDTIRRYMDENPLRARIRQECPRLMERRLHLWIAGREYAAFGNLFLLKYPMKQQVFFHRRDAETGQPTETTEAYQKEHARLLKMAEEGTVLVTPGISKGEMLVVSAALDARLPLILLQKEPISDFWKPSQRRFYACASGRLLILAPWKMEGTSDYARFHQLNDFAREICEATDLRIVNYDQLSQSS